MNPVSSSFVVRRLAILRSKFVLRADRISFRYGAASPWTVRNISIGIEPGMVLGLSGPSGQGKTTLAKLLAGYLMPTGGVVLLDDAPLADRTYCPVQLVLQHPELAVNPRWRIKQILTESYTPALQLQKALGIERDWYERWPHELSGGELQRIAVARALGPQTRYLIADEMTAMLDANTQAQIWHAVLAHARQSNLGVLVISHDAPLLERLCNRVVTMTELIQG